MKEIKAYVRPEKAEDVISELELNGSMGMTVIDVSVLGSWIDPDKSKISMEFCERYSNNTRIDLVCPDEELDKFVNIILEKAHTGHKGDGKIFILDISDSISIRTKEHGIRALKNNN